jgi:hypothetical protein
VLQARGFAGLVLLSRPLSEEATPNFRKPSSVQGHHNFSEHLDHPWVLDRPIVECRFLSLGWRVASFDHDVEVVRIFTIHTSFDPAGFSGQGLPLEPRARELRRRTGLTSHQYRWVDTSSAMRSMSASVIRNQLSQHLKERRTSRTGIDPAAADPFLGLAIEMASST